jgi:threonyl-tRNA synthetase
VIGEKEMNDNKVSVRRQGHGDLGAKDLDAFLNEVVDEVKQRRS